MHASNFQSRHQQQGIATVLIVVLLGLSLTITILVGLSNLRSSQELGVSMHTQTVTQQRAWSAAEALREYLQEVTADYTDWLEFLDNFDLDNNVYPAITMTGFEGLQAQFIGVDDTDPDLLKFSALVTAEAAPGTRIASKSALEITFEVVPPVPEEVNPPSVPSRNVITFYDGLDVSGGIDIVAEAGKTYDVFVDGNVTLGSASLTGMDSVLSTKSIDYTGGSGTNFNLLHASCDIRIRNTSDLVQHAKATANICFDGGPASSLIEANGFITIDRTGNTHEALWSHANVDGVASCASGATRLCNSFSNSDGIETIGGNTIQRAYTRGSIRSPHDNGNTALDWRAEKEIIITGGCGNLTAQALDNMHAVDGVGGCKAGDSSVVVNPPIIQPVVLDRETFDANDFRGVANFVYHRHNGATRVLVRNVDGIPDHDDPSNPQDIRDNGYYHRAARDTSEVWWDRMVSNHACRTATSDIATEDENCWLLATANNDTTNLPNFDNGNWDFSGLHHAPGIVFLDGGNVQIGQGAYTITFIATGNITQTTSNNGVAAPNFVGPDTRSIATANATFVTFQGVCNNVYGLSPKDFCDGGGFNSSALSGLGNFALKAGSCPTNSPGMCTTSQYNGGDISISKPVLGVIKAGNIFSTSGDTRLQGYVSALALRGTGTINRIGNRTVIDLSDLPEGYDPTGGAVDPGDGSGGNGNGGGGTEEAGSATLLWTRYL